MNRKSLKDQKRDNALSMRYYARLSDKPDPEIPMGSVKRGPRQPRKDGLKSEAQVQTEIIDFLLDNRHVALIERVNSGVMQEGDRYVRFNTVMIPNRLRSFSEREKVAKSDLQAMLINGKLMVVEVKKEGWKYSGTDREKQQLAYINHVKKYWGLALFAQSVEDVRKELIVNGYA